MHGWLFRAAQVRKGGRTDLTVIVIPYDDIGLQD